MTWQLSLSWIWKDKWCSTLSSIMFFYESLVVREFPGSPMVRTLHFHYWGPRFNPCPGNGYLTRCAVQPKNNNNDNFLKAGSLGLSWWLSAKESSCQCRRHGFHPWSGKIPRAVEQLSPWATTTEPVLWRPRSASREASAMSSPTT